MAISELEARAAAADEDVDALRLHLVRLRNALNAALAAQALAKRELRGLRLILDDARATEAHLEAELDLARAEAAALRRELLHARTTAELRGRLLDEIAAAPVWRRGGA